MEFVNHVTVLAGLAVMAIQQILKLNAVPGSLANRHPVPVLILLSAGASAFVVWTNRLMTPHAWTDWIVLGATVTLVAAVTYNMTLKNWAQLRAMEGPGV